MPIIQKQFSRTILIYLSWTDSTFLNILSKKDSGRKILSFIKTNYEQFISRQSETRYSKNKCMPCEYISPLCNSPHLALQHSYLNLCLNSKWLLKKTAFNSIWRIILSSQRISQRDPSSLFLKRLSRYKRMLSCPEKEPLEAVY